MEDTESGERLLLDTNRHAVRQRFADLAQRRRLNLSRLARAAQADLIEVGTDGRHLEALFHFFRLRERRLRSH